MDADESVLRGESSVLKPYGVSSRGYVNARLIKSGAAVCYGLSGYNSSTSSQFVQVHDLAAVPTNGLVPVVILAVPASSNFSVDFGTHGRAFQQGIAVCNSSTGDTTTLGSADTWFDVVLV